MSVATLARTMASGAQGTAGMEAARATGSRLATEEAAEIAVEGYVYGFPLVLMETSRRVMSNVDPAAGAAGLGASMNQFAHRRTFPDAKFTDVVRPNADTLYSSLWFDVAHEPLIISVPDSGGRYYLLPMLDMWTDVFASPGKRTTGTAARRFGLVGPGWDGELPRDIEPIRSPTSAGWIIGRTQTNGTADFDSVHQFQAGMSAVPLSAWGNYYEPPEAKFDRGASKLPPGEQVARMDGATFFAFLAELLRVYTPHANDYPVLQRLARIGLHAGRPFDVAAVSPEIRSALTAAPAAAQERMRDFSLRSDPVVNGWMTIRNPVGTYGTAYLKRAVVAAMGLGANVLEDAFYPTAFADADGRPLSSSERYVVHFARGQLPPARAFWSLTLYDDRQLFADNPINRYAIGDRDNVKPNSDGSLDIYIQRAVPEGDKQRNWLPAPAAGSFTMNLRLYWPEPAAINGRWAPPPVRRVT
jgi:hypothetical protein